MSTRLEAKNIFTLFLLLLLCSCASSRESALMYQASSSLNNGQQVYSNIKEVLYQRGDMIDYDTLLWVYREMVLNNTHIPNSGDLVSLLIQKKNEHPRVDSMILIFASDIIGNSHAPMDNVEDLFKTMLMQDQRLNLWVLSFIGDAIGKYVYDIPEGDFLVDLLEQRVTEHTSGHTLSKEFFGNHFLPPPKQEYIINYIEGIEDQETRVLERNCYYNLIISEWSEAQIEKALRQLQTHGIEGTDEKTQRPLKYLILHPDQFDSPSVQTKTLSHPTF